MKDIKTCKICFKPEGEVKFYKNKDGYSHKRCTYCYIDSSMKRVKGAKERRIQAIRDGVREFFISKT